MTSYMQTSWICYLMELNEAAPHVIDERTVIITNWEKGHVAIDGNMLKVSKKQFTSNN